MTKASSLSFGHTIHGQTVTRVSYNLSLHWSSERPITVEHLSASIHLNVPDARSVAYAILGACDDHYRWTKEQICNPKPL